jgi:transposase-like protein
LIQKQDSSKRKLINTTEKKRKLLANDMYINQMKINKLNKKLGILKEDYAKMIVKSYKSSFRTK